MIFTTMVELPMYRKLHVPIVLSLGEWEKRFLMRSTRAKKEKYKENFMKFHKLVKLARTCDAIHLNVKSLDKSMKFIFDFNSEENMIKFTQLLSDDSSYQI